MKRLFLTAFLLGPGLIPAEEITRPRIPQSAAGSYAQAAPRAWLGLDVSKPDVSITTHLPELPPGFGFVVKSIQKEGPAEKGGLQTYDVVWKFNDQMLVNESQLACLLRLANPGDEVSLECFRGGKPITVKVTLGDAEEHKRQFPDDLVEDAILPGACRGPWRVTDVNMSDKSASFSSAEEGKAVVRKEGDTYKLCITGPNEEAIYNGDFPINEAGASPIPEEWRRRVFALRRGLDHALEGRMVPQRQPRPRIVPPSPVDK